MQSQATALVPGTDVGELVYLNATARDYGLDRDALRRLVGRHGLTLGERQHGQQTRLLVSREEIDEMIGRLRANPERCRGCGEPVELGREWHRGCAVRAARAADASGELAPLGLLAAEHGIAWQALRGVLDRHGVRLERQQAGRVTKWLAPRAEVEELIGRLIGDPERCPGCDQPVPLGARWHQRCNLAARRATQDPATLEANAAAMRARVATAVEAVRAEGMFEMPELLDRLRAQSLYYSAERVFEIARMVGRGLRRPGCGRRRFFTEADVDPIAEALRQTRPELVNARRDEVHAADRLLTRDVARMVLRSPQKVLRWAQMFELGRAEPLVGRTFSQEEAEEIATHIRHNQLAGWHGDLDWHIWHAERSHPESTRTHGRQAGRKAASRGKQIGRPRESSLDVFVQDEVMGLRRDGLSFEQIKQRLNAQGLKTRKGQPITLGHVRYVIAHCAENPPATV